jgi:hypothetical protein
MGCSCYFDDPARDSFVSLDPSDKDIFADFFYDTDKDIFADFFLCY